MCLGLGRCRLGGSRNSSRLSLCFLSPASSAGVAVLCKTALRIEEDGDSINYRCLWTRLNMQKACSTAGALVPSANCSLQMAAIFFNKARSQGFGLSQAQDYVSLTVSRWSDGDYCCWKFSIFSAQVGVGVSR